MNNFNNCFEIDLINSQLERAEIQKIKLIRNIYREYELYLNLVRDLLHISVEKGLNELFSHRSIKDNFLNIDELYSFIKKNISGIIHSKLPLLTVEQLKINKTEKNKKMKINLSNLEYSPQRNDVQKENFQYEDYLKSQEPTQFEISENISYASEYYQAYNYEKFGSLDLDKNVHNNYLSDNNIIENIGLEKELIASLLELIEEVNVEKTIHLENDNINQIDISTKNQRFKVFDLIDKSLENLLLNLSYKINQELFKVNLIKKMISQDSFQYLVSKKMMVKHPHPFVINFEFNINKLSPNGDNLPSIIFFNISPVELEFKNLNLSIKRNKINELKAQFQRLIKKETYWRQKEKTLNNIR